MTEMVTTEVVPNGGMTTDTIVLIVAFSAVAVVLLITGLTWVYLYKHPRVARLGQPKSAVKESYHVTDPDGASPEQNGDVVKPVEQA